MEVQTREGKRPGSQTRVIDQVLLHDTVSLLNSQATSGPLLLSPAGVKKEQPLNHSQPNLFATEP